MLDKINNTLDHKLNPPGVYFRDQKGNGYQEDERDQTTHPIRLTVENTDEAMDIFDGITLGKGGGVLKQLMFVVG